MTFNRYGTFLKVHFSKSTNLEQNLNSNLIKTCSLKRVLRLSYFVESNYSKKECLHPTFSHWYKCILRMLHYMAISPIFVSFPCKKVFLHTETKYYPLFYLREIQNIFKGYQCLVIIFHVWVCRKYFFAPYSLETER